MQDSSLSGLEASLPSKGGFLYSSIYKNLFLKHAFFLAPQLLFNNQLFDFKFYAAYFEAAKKIE